MRRQHTRRTAVAVLGAASTLLLHSLFFAAVMWGGGLAPQAPDLPDAMGAGANHGTPDGDSSERRMIVRLLSDAGAKPAPHAPDAHLAELLQSALEVEITGPDTLPLPPLEFVENDVRAESTDAELMARAKMAGIYESQIRARIERAWMLPPDSAAGPSFTCRVLIRQSSDGRVSEVELPYEGCEGAPQMRQSLVSAIFAASPLPAPPHPGAFVDSFSLVLRSEKVARH